MVRSEETKRKIAEAMLGKVKSKEERMRISATMKGRVPWNKGKQMSEETKLRMSEARNALAPWNKGRELSELHRRRIGMALTGRVVSEGTRKLLQIARRMPSDSVLAGGNSNAAKDAPGKGGFPLVATEDIHSYIALRRSLQGWSEGFKNSMGRRPTLADVRRLAPLEIIRKFEEYSEMRNRLRGLTTDVVGVVNPESIPADAPGARRWNSLELVVEEESEPRRLEPSGFLSVNERDLHTSQAPDGRLSAADYRLIGRYRLMETHDIHSFIHLRREVKLWSRGFQEQHGRIPAFSDAFESDDLNIREKCIRYLRLRDKIVGLVREVYDDPVEDLDKFLEVSERAKEALKALRGGQDSLQAEGRGL
uniref:Nuclease associated modular domain-containing protein n=1 Tax=Compsopogon caeruleus TaxID=31354 RepID=A0A7S1TIM1_9RHOD